MASNLSLFVKLGVDLKGLEKGLKAASAKLEGFGKSMTKTGKDLSMKVTAPVGVLGGLALKTAADFEKLRISMDTLTGSAEEGARAFERLQEFAAGTPFKLNELARATTTMMGFGLSADEAHDSLKMIGDIAAVSGGDLQGISLAFSQVAAAGRLMGQDLLQLINNGVPIIDMLSESMGVAKSEIKDLVSEGGVSFEDLQKAFRDATSEGGKFAGGMEKQSKTIAGLFSTLSDNVTMALGELGNAISEAFNLSENIPKLTEFIQGLVERFKDLSPAARQFIVIGGALAAALGPALIIIGQMSIGLSAIGKAAVFAAARVVKFNLAVLVNPYIAAAAAIAGIGVAMYGLIAPTKAATIQQVEFKEALEKQKKVVDDLVTSLDKIKLMREEEARAVIESTQKEIKEIQKKASHYEQMIDSLSPEEVTKRVKALEEEERGLLEQMANGVRTGTQLTDVQRRLDDARATGSEQVDSLRQELLKLREQENQLKVALEEAQKALNNNKNAITENASETAYFAKMVAMARSEYEALAGASLSMNMIGGTWIGKLNKEAPDLTKNLQDINDEIMTIPSNMLRSAEDTKKLISELDRLQAAAVQVQTATEQYLVDGLSAGIQTLVQTAMQGGNVFENVMIGLLSGLADLAVTIGKIVLATGIAISGLQKALESISGPVAIIAGLALIAVGTAAKGMLANAAPPTAFADGGIVSGPTLGLVGEYPGAKSNPEVIAPLNKLQNMLGGVQGDVRFVIEGDNLVGILERKSYSSGRL